jgi:hypothetical protein
MVQAAAQLHFLRLQCREDLLLRRREQPPLRFANLLDLVLNVPSEPAREKKKIRERKCF